MSFYRFVQGTFGWAMRLFYGIKISGNTESLERLKKGGVLVCSNHTSMLDPAMMMASFKPVIRFMAKKEIFKIPLLAAFFKGMCAFPVNRGGADVGTIRSTTKLLEDGANVGIFPQGTRRKYVDPSTTEVKSGVGMLSFRSGCDVLPLYIKTSNNHVHFLGKTEIIVGDIINNDDFGFEKGGMDEYRRASDLIFAKICSLGGYTYLPEAKKKAELSSSPIDKNAAGDALCGAESSDDESADGAVNVSDGRVNISGNGAEDEK